MREIQIHKAVAEYLSLALQPPTFWTTIGHGPRGGGLGGMMRGKQIKAMGAKAGFPDLIIIHEGKLFGIELKAPKKYPSPEQRAVHKELRNAGCEVFIARSVMEVALALETWAIPLRAKVAA